MAKSPVLLRWKAQNTFGWGVAGLNIFCHWAVSGDVAPHMLWPISDADMQAIEPMRRALIASQVAQSNALAARLAASPAAALTLKIPVVHAIGNGYGSGQTKQITGSRNIGRIVFEETRLDDRPRPITGCDILVCASEWNASLLRAKLDVPVEVIHEGVDPSLFHPAPKSGMIDAGRFYIFSGGKIEFRKAQDLVIKAFKVFSERHADAVLVTAWHSPLLTGKGYRGTLSAPIEVGADNLLNFRKWVADNGVDPAKMIDIGPVPNQLMPQILREMDCALLPSRAEGGTNIVAMEAMACGLPVILGNNTGLRDLIDGANCVPLNRQGEVKHPTDRGADGWGESDIEEMVGALEDLYQSPERRRQIGAAASASMRDWTWARHAAALARVVV
jgi:glycosyltransferase involved in cell wall biosynthesis